MMQRIPALTVDEMTSRQLEVYEQILSGRRSALIGPLVAAIYSPDLARPWSELGQYLRFDADIPPRLKELAITLIGRRWSSEVEWWVHSNLAIGEGISQDVMDAIRLGRAPVFTAEDEAEVYSFVRHIQLDGHVPQALYDALKARLGLTPLIELGALVGYYNMVAITLNLHQIALPDGVQPAFSDMHCHRMADLPEALQANGAPWRWAA